MILVSKPIFIRLPNLLVQTEIKEGWRPSRKSNMAATKLNFLCIKSLVHGIEACMIFVSMQTYVYEGAPSYGAAKDIRRRC